MPRIARSVLSGIPHHVTQRGNNRQDVFFVDADREHYLELLQAQTERHGVRVDGYCLMTNHVHLVLRPSRAEGLAKALGRTHFLYTQYINRDLQAWVGSGAAKEWASLLIREEDAELTGKLLQSLRTGRPLGTDSFISKVELLLGRRLRAKPVGRPRREPGRR